jgi:Xaa-Pro aminopeptidase
MRLTKLRQKLADEQLDAILISNPANRRYLSGFTGSAGTLIVTLDRALLATDFRYYAQVEREAPRFELVKLTDRLTDLLPGLLGEMGSLRVGFEGDDVTFSLYRELSNVIPEGVELVATSNIVEEIRAAKDVDELHKLQQAIDLTDAAYAHIADFMQPGMTERQVAWELERFVRTHGAEKMAFNIVAAGPNGALPHATPSDRPIQAGDSVVMDIGALVDGYHSDLTRTVVLGEATDRYRQVYEIVLRAQQAALEGIRPGMTGREADAIARGIIEEAGYGEYFGHGLGHGLGLVVHERPWLSHRRQAGSEVLHPGMVFTVEPGIYLPGEFGVRIEDVVLLREEGPQVLSRAAKEPLLAGPPIKEIR